MPVTCSANKTLGHRVSHERSPLGSSRASGPGAEGAERVRRRHPRARVWLPDFSPGTLAKFAASFLCDRSQL